MIHKVLNNVGIQFCRCSDIDRVTRLVEKIHATPSSREKCLLGDGGDGSYHVPKNLSGIGRCFSPGVGPRVDFDLEIAGMGIPVSMIDGSVDGPPISHALFSFKPLYLGTFSSEEHSLITFEDWVNLESLDNSEGNWMLQMDIEGGEWQVIHALSGGMLERIEVLIVEFHNMHQMLNCNWFPLMDSAFDKLLKYYEVLHVEENTAAGFFFVGKRKMSRLLEITFVKR